MNIETVSYFTTVIMFTCLSFNYIVIRPLKNLIIQLSKVVESIQQDLKRYDLQREISEKKILILESELHELKKQHDKKTCM